MEGKDEWKAQEKQNKGEKKTTDQAFLSPDRFLESLFQGIDPFLKSSSFLFLLSESFCGSGKEMNIEIMINPRVSGMGKDKRGGK